jgi:predicted HicB family RNase H-like nuclease
VSELLKFRLPSRYGSLYIPEDDTLRSMFMTGMVKRDITEQQRRLFSTIFNVRVFSELTQSAALTAHEVVSINLTVSDTAS